MKYDYIIITDNLYGLILAYYLGKYNKKCLLIDQNINYKLLNFYSDGYLNFTNLLNNININVNNLNKNNIYSEFINIFNTYEILLLLFEFIIILFNNKNSKNMNINYFMIKYNFSEKSKKCIFDICKLTNNNYQLNNISLYEFLKLFNELSLNNIYKLPELTQNEIFLLLKKEASKNNTKILSDKNISSIDIELNNIKSINIDNNKYESEKFILSSNLNLNIYSKKINNLYNCNIFNNNDNNYVSMESNIKKLINLLHLLEPELKNINKIINNENIIDIILSLLFIGYYLYLYDNIIKNKI